MKTDEGMTAQAAGNPLKVEAKNKLGRKCRPFPRLALELDSFLIAGKYCAPDGDGTIDPKMRDCFPTQLRVQSVILTK